jgi:hypothetical protein
MGIVSADLNGIDRYHPQTWVLEIPDELGKIALDLICQAQISIGQDFFVPRHR